MVGPRVSIKVTLTPTHEKMVLVVEDVDALHAELKTRGVTIDLEPTDQSWGNREMYVRDPDGNSIRFVHGGR